MAAPHAAEQPAAAAADILARLYPDARSELQARTGWEFVVASILLPGTTAMLVGQLAAVLHEHHAGPAAVARLSRHDVEDLLRRLPDARRKARSVVEAARHLVRHHHGLVPLDVDDLARVPGLGRAGACRILAEYHGRPAVAADEPVRWVVRRWGWTEGDGIAAAERAVARRLPTDGWIVFVHRLRRFARDTCRRGRPRCDGCPLGDTCPTAVSAAGEPDDVDGV